MMIIFVMVMVMVISIQINYWMTAKMRRSLIC